MRLAEIPAVASIGRLGCRAIARLLAAVPVAQSDRGRLTRRSIAAPSRKAPIERTAGAGHIMRSEVVRLVRITSSLREVEAEGKVAITPWDTPRNMLLRRYGALTH